MNSRDTSSSRRDSSWWRQVVQNLRLAWRLMKDPSVPLGFKLIPLVALLYVLVPTDFVPDFIPGLGQVDDLTVLLLGLKLFIDVCPGGIVEGYQAQMSSVDATYEVVDDSDTGNDTVRRLTAGEQGEPSDEVRLGD